MQRRASSRYGAGKAAVGHTSRQARQLPQWSASAASGGNSRDRKSTRLNSSHLGISYAVFCLKKKKPTTDGQQRDGPTSRPSSCPGPSDSPRSSVERRSPNDLGSRRSALSPTEAGNVLVRSTT